MSDWREFAYEADRDSGIEYGGEDSDTEIARLRARIRELEERLRERDLAVAALSQDRDEAYDRGVRDGIERVRKEVLAMPVNHFLGTKACEDALAAYNKEAGRE